MGKARVLEGKDLMLWLGGKVVALSTSCSLNLEGQTQDAATKDDGVWNDTEISNRSWNVSNESFDAVDETRTTDHVFDDLFDLFVAGTKVDVTVGVPTNKAADGVPEDGWAEPTAKCYKGKAVITSLSRTGAKGSNGSVSVSLSGCGALTKA